MSLIDDARAWRDQDPDDATRAELDALISSAEAGDTEPLAELLRDRRLAVRHGRDCAASWARPRPA